MTVLPQKLTSDKEEGKATTSDAAHKIAKRRVIKKIDKW